MKFLKAMNIYGKDWTKVSQYVGNKNYMQCASHYVFINSKKEDSKKLSQKNNVEIGI